ncbi:hypothetical protein H4R34_000930 [Dimargaris verticillata]|uniref:Non-specific serine/threonine protein kinase n=1 Tax=Dimargaris verticillata TaxID=2761393 RepID=A0A9W8EFG6_9FUNG|nr:hypothetical protein H4R34_000930 [Dimargaris verticillata]
MPPIAPLQFTSCVKALTGIRSQGGGSARNPPPCITDLLELSRQCTQWTAQDAKSVTDADDLLVLLLHPLLLVATSVENAKAWRKEVNVVRVFESAMVPDEAKTNFCKAIATAAGMSRQTLPTTIRWIGHRLEPHEVPREPDQARHLIPEITQKIAARNNWLLAVLTEIVLQFSRSEPLSSPGRESMPRNPRQLALTIAELSQTVLDFARPTTAPATLPLVVALTRAIVAQFPKQMARKGPQFYTLFVRWVNWSAATSALRKELWSTLPVLASLPHFPPPIVPRVAHHAMQQLAKRVTNYLATDDNRDVAKELAVALDTTAVLIHPAVLATPLPETHQSPPNPSAPLPHLQRFIELGVQAARHRPEAMLWDSALRSFSAYSAITPLAVLPAQATIVQLILSMLNQAGLSMTSSGLPICSARLDIALRGLEALLTAWRSHLSPSVLPLLISDDNPLWMVPPPILLQASTVSSVLARWSSILAQLTSLALQSCPSLGDSSGSPVFESHLAAYISHTLTDLPGTLASLVTSEDTWPELPSANFHARLWQGLVNLMAQCDHKRDPAALHQSLKFRYAQAVFCSHRTFFGHLLALQPVFSPWQALIHAQWPLFCGRLPFQAEPAHADLLAGPHATHAELTGDQLRVKFRFQWIALTRLTVLASPDLAKSCHEPLPQSLLQQCARFVHQFIGISWYILGTQSLSSLHGDIWSTWLTAYQQLMEHVLLPFEHMLGITGQLLTLPDSAISRTTAVGLMENLTSCMGDRLPLLRIEFADEHLQPLVKALGRVLTYRLRTAIGQSEVSAALACLDALGQSVGATWLPSDCCEALWEGQFSANQAVQTQYASAWTRLHPALRHQYIVDAGRLTKPHGQSDAMPDPLFTLEHTMATLACMGIYITSGPSPSLALLPMATVATDYASALSQLHRLFQAIHPHSPLPPWPTLYKADDLDRRARPALLVAEGTSQALEWMLAQTAKSCVAHQLSIPGANAPFSLLNALLAVTAQFKAIGTLSVTHPAFFVQLATAANFGKFVFYLAQSLHQTLHGAGNTSGNPKLDDRLAIRRWQSTVCFYRQSRTRIDAYLRQGRSHWAAIAQTIEDWPAAMCHTRELYASHCQTAMTALNPDQHLPSAARCVATAYMLARDLCQLHQGHEIRSIKDQVQHVLGALAPSLPLALHTPLLTTVDRHLIAFHQLALGRLREAWTTTVLAPTSKLPPGMDLVHQRFDTYIASTCLMDTLDSAYITYCQQRLQTFDLPGNDGERALPLGPTAIIDPRTLQLAAAMESLQGELISQSLDAIVDSTALPSASGASDFWQGSNCTLLYPAQIPLYTRGSAFEDLVVSLTPNRLDDAPIANPIDHLTLRHLCTSFATSTMMASAWSPASLQWDYPTKRVASSYPGGSTPLPKAIALLIGLNDDRACCSAAIATFMDRNLGSLAQLYKLACSEWLRPVQQRRQQDSPSLTDPSIIFQTQAVQALIAVGAYLGDRAHAVGQDQLAATLFHATMSNEPEQVLPSLPLQATTPDTLHHRLHRLRLGLIQVHLSDSTATPDLEWAALDHDLAPCVQLKPHGTVNCTYSRAGLTLVASYCAMHPLRTHHLLVDQLASLEPFTKTSPSGCTPLITRCLTVAAAVDAPNPCVLLVAWASQFTYTESWKTKDNLLDRLMQRGNEWLLLGRYFDTLCQRYTPLQRNKNGEMSGTSDTPVLRPLEQATEKLYHHLVTAEAAYATSSAPCPLSLTDFFTTLLNTLEMQSTLPSDSSDHPWLAWPVFVECLHKVWPAPHASSSDLVALLWSNASVKPLASSLYDAYLDNWQTRRTLTECVLDCYTHYLVIQVNGPTLLSRDHTVARPITRIVEGVARFHLGSSLSADLQHVVVAHAGAWCDLTPQLFALLSHQCVQTRQWGGEMLSAVVSVVADRALLPGWLSFRAALAQLVTKITTCRRSRIGLASDTARWLRVLLTQAQSNSHRALYTEAPDTFLVDTGSEIQQITDELHHIAVLWEEQLLDHLNRLLPLLSPLRQRKACKELPLITASPPQALLTEPAVAHAVRAFQSFHQALTDATSLSPHETWFMQHLYPPMDRAIRALIAVRSPHDLTTVIQLLERLSSQAKRVISSTRTLPLTRLSPFLATYRGQRVHLLALRSNAPVALTEFQPTVTVLESKTRPKLLQLRGTDGCLYTYLLKGLDNLRVDELMMQCLGAFNRWGATSTAENPLAPDPTFRPMPITQYEVIPLSDHSGLVEWVPSAQSIYQTYRRWCRQEQSLHQATRLPDYAVPNQPASLPSTSKATSLAAERPQSQRGLKRYPPRRGKSSKPDSPAAKPHPTPINFLSPGKQFFEVTQRYFRLHRDARFCGDRTKYPTTVWRSIYDQLLQVAPKDLIRHELYTLSTSPAHWYHRQLTFTESMAILSILGYALGWGDRHLDNILLHAHSGAVVHVDFSVCFDQGRRLKVPETVPFRLTPNFVRALGLVGPVEPISTPPTFAGLNPLPASAEDDTPPCLPTPTSTSQVQGAFRHGCIETMQLLRHHAAEWQTLLSCLVWHPLAQWYPGYHSLDLLAINTCPSLRPVTKCTGLEYRVSAAGSDSSVSSLPVRAVAETFRGLDLSVNPEDFARELSVVGDTAELPAYQSAQAPVLSQPSTMLHNDTLGPDQSPLPDGAANSTLRARTFIYHALDHSRRKLFTDARSDPRAVPDVVDKLITTAINPDNLAQMYEGWAPWI